MSANLPTPHDAYNHLFQQVHATTFMNKLAAAGIVPQTDAEATDLYKLAGELRQHVAARQQVTGNRFAPATAALQKLAAANPVLQQARQDQAVKLAAAQLLQDPSIYNSLLSLHLSDTALANGQHA
jgi:hypothetical protein